MGHPSVSHPSLSYDVIADEYTAAFCDDWVRTPFDRDVLRAFTQLAGNTPGLVLDVGCGGGHTTAELVRDGLDVVGVDRSAAMVGAGRRRVPQAGFVVADMSALPVPDSSCAGICSWYSVVHTPTPELPALLSEFRRVIIERGWILLAFQTNAEPLELTTAFGHDVQLTFLRHDVSSVLTALSGAGFTPRRHVVRPRDPEHETADQAFVIARAH